tara:strand:+ start:1376 stop:1576 length:201 start_codon:yes stop_codon:yes gene_type:complete
MPRFEKSHSILGGLINTNHSTESFKSNSNEGFRNKKNMYANNIGVLQKSFVFHSDVYNPHATDFPT